LNHSLIFWIGSIRR